MMLVCATVELLEFSKVVAELDQFALMPPTARQLTVSELVSYLISLLTSVSSSADQTSSDPINVQLHADLILNWLLNVYDQ